MPGKRQRLSEIWRRIVIRATLVDLARARLLHDRPSIVDDLIELGRRRAESREVNVAEEAFAQARDLAIKIGYEPGIARANVGLAGVARERGDFAAAAQVLEAEMPRLRRLAGRTFLAWSLVNLGEALAYSDQVDSAGDVFHEADLVATEIGDWKQKARATHGLAGIDYAEERFEEAYRRWSEAFSIYKRHRNRGGMAFMQHYLSGAAGNLHRFAEGRQLAVESIRNYELAGRPDLAASARDYLAAIDEFINDQEAADSDDQS